MALCKLGVLMLLVFVQCEAFGGFLDNFGGFDFFKQFNHQMDQISQASREQAQRVASMFEPEGERDPLPGLEIEGADEDVVSLPELPGFSQVHTPGGFFNMFGQGFGRQPWWKGPNVCVEREEIDESAHRNDTKAVEGEDAEEGGFFGAFEFSTCHQSEKRYTCTTKIRNHGIKKTLTVKYQCCHGHQRVAGKPGCTQVDLKSMADTAVDLGAKDFVQLMKTANLEEKLSETNQTVFMPSDDALRDFTDSMQAANQVEFFVPPGDKARRRRSVQGMSLREIALGHITQNVYEVSELENEQILYSDNNNSTLRINVYPSANERIVTCNCARLIKPDNLAENGVVHIIDRVIRPVTKTLAELVEEDEQLTTLKEMLTKTEMMESLTNGEHLTLFAPSDEAFKKLPEALMKRFSEGHSCLKNVLKHHIVPHTLCTEAVQTTAITVNKGGDPVHVERRASGQVFVEDVQVVVKDIIGTNGVIHIIEAVMVPDSAKTMSEVLASSNHTMFLEMLKEAKLIDSLDAMENITLFVPSDKALEDPKVAAQLDSVRSDTDKLRDILLYHTAGPRTESCDLANDLTLKTNMADQSIKINLYAMQPFFMGFRQMATAQCARLLNVDAKSCGGIIHTVDRLLVPPTKSVLEQIQDDEKFSTLSGILKDTELEASLKDKSPITFLAPVNEAFDDIDPEDLKRLQSDKEFAVKVLKKHILPESVCCAGVQTAAWPFTSRVETMLGGSIPIRRDPDGGVHFGTTTAQNCDIMATNGLIHAVNRVMVPRSTGLRLNSGIQRFGNPNVDIVFYGL